MALCIFAQLNILQQATITLGLEADQAKWDIFSEGFYWTDVLVSWHSL